MTRSESSDRAAGVPSAQGIAEAVRATRTRGLPPVESWNPPFCGDIDMRIARDGTWFHEGTPIGRPGLVRLFASILKREGDRYFLVTPVEKVGIIVDDAPFVAIDFDAASDPGGPALRFETNVGDHVVADADHPIRVERDPDTGEPAPYVLVRRNLEALIDRKSFYRLVERAEHRDVGGESWFGVESAGSFFKIAPSDEVEE